MTKPNDQAAFPVVWMGHDSARFNVQKKQLEEAIRAQGEEGES